MEYRGRSRKGNDICHTRRSVRTQPTFQTALSTTPCTESLKARQRGALFWHRHRSNQSSSGQYHSIHIRTSVSFVRPLATRMATKLSKLSCLSSRVIPVVSQCTSCQTMKRTVTTINQYLHTYLQRFPQLPRESLRQNHPTMTATPRLSQLNPFHLNSKTLRIPI